MMPSAVRMQVSAAHPRNLMLVRRGREATRPVTIVATATKTAVQVACREIALRAVERVMKAEPPTKTQNWRDGKERKEGEEGRKGQLSIYLSGRIGRTYEPVADVTNPLSDGAEDELHAVADRVDLRVVEFEHANLHVGPGCYGGEEEEDDAAGNNAEDLHRRGNGAAIEKAGSVGAGGKGEKGQTNSTPIPI